MEWNTRQGSVLERPSERGVSGGAIAYTPYSTDQVVTDYCPLTEGEWRRTLS